MHLIHIYVIYINIIHMYVIYGIYIIYHICVRFRNHSTVILKSQQHLHTLISESYHCDFEIIPLRFRNHTTVISKSQQHLRTAILKSQHCDFEPLHLAVLRFQHCSAEIWVQLANHRLRFRNRNLQVWFWNLGEQKVTRFRNNEIKVGCDFRK